MTTTTTLTIRVNPEVKEAARARADALGLSMSTLLENDLRQFINGRPVVIDEDSYIPTERLGASIEAADEAHAAGDYIRVNKDNLDNVFGAFAATSTDEADEVFDALRKAQQ